MSNIDIEEAGVTGMSWETLDGSRTSIFAMDTNGSYDVEADCDISATAALLDDNIATCCRWNINDVTNVMLTIDPTYLTTWEMGAVRGTWDWAIGNDSIHACPILMAPQVH